MCMLSPSCVPRSHVTVTCNKRWRSSSRSWSVDVSVGLLTHRGGGGGGGGWTCLLSVLRGSEVVWRGETSFLFRTNYDITLLLVSRKKAERTQSLTFTNPLVKVHQIKPLIVSLKMHSEYEWSPTGVVGKTLLFADWCSVRRSILVLITMLFCRIGNILPLFKIILLAISKVPKKTFCRLI